MDLVAQARRHHCHDDVRDIDDVDFILADPDSLDQDYIIAGCFQYQRCIAGRLGKPSMMSTSCHASDIHPVIQCVFLHSDSVTQQGAACDRATDIDRKHPHLQTLPSIEVHQAVDHCALSSSGIPRHPDYPRPTRGAVEEAQRFSAARMVFQHGDQA